MPLYEDSAPRDNDAPRPRAWVIRYREGTFINGEFTNADEFSHLDGEPWDAPRRLGTFCTYTDEWGDRREVADDDYILYLRAAPEGGARTEGAFVGGDQKGVNDRTGDGESFVQIHGKWVPDGEFYRTQEIVRKDKRFPNAIMNRDEILEMLNGAVADTGMNKLEIIQQAIFDARNMGYPFHPFISDVVEEPLRIELNRRAGRV